MSPTGTPYRRDARASIALPSQGNVHQVAQEVDPAARVVYVDNDPMVLVHGRALLATDGSTKVLQADARDPRSILENDQVKDFIDFSKPVGLLMLSILHHLHDQEDPAGVAATLRAPLVRHTPLHAVEDDRTATLRTTDEPARPV